MTQPSGTDDQPLDYDESQVSAKPDKKEEFQKALLKIARGIGRTVGRETGLTTIAGKAERGLGLESEKKKQSRKRTEERAARYINKEKAIVRSKRPDNTEKVAAATQHVPRTGLYGETGPEIHSGVNMTLDPGHIQAQAAAAATRADGTRLSYTQGAKVRVVPGTLSKILDWLAEHQDMYILLSDGETKLTVKIGLLGPYHEQGERGQVNLGGFGTAAVQVTKNVTSFATGAIGKFDALQPDADDKVQDALKKVNTVQKKVHGHREKSKKEKEKDAADFVWNRNEIPLKLTFHEGDSGVGDSVEECHKTLTATHTEMLTLDGQNNASSRHYVQMSDLVTHVKGLAGRYLGILENEGMVV